jgi:hypothetical protein
MGMQLVQLEVNQNIKGADKDDVEKLIHEIKELLPDHTAKPKIRKLLGKILTKTSEVSQIVQLISTILIQLT